MIKYGIDAMSFVDRIVAYETNISYYGSQTSHWQKVDGPTPLYFGYFTSEAQEWSSGERTDKGPNMSTVLKPNAVPGNRAIIQNKIEGHRRTPEMPFLKMREATADEIAAIKQAVASFQAKIEYDDPGFMRALGMSDFRRRQVQKKPRAPGMVS